MSRTALITGARNHPILIEGGDYRTLKPEPEIAMSCDPLFILHPSSFILLPSSFGRRGER
jgi:hypothetical protein